MMHYNCRDVVLVDVVFSDGSGVKKRPALVISSKEYHLNRQEVIIAAITSNIRRALVGDTKLKKWEEAKLLFPSLVTGIIQTVKSDMIDRKIGVLEKQDFRQVQKNLNRVLEI